MTDQHTSSGGACRICGGAPSETFSVREMMFGTRDVFPYFQCADCGCLQIAEVPADLGGYYPDGYYSFEPNRKRVRPLKRAVRRARARFAVERTGLFGRLLDWRRKADPLLVMYGDIGVRISDRVLDVGGGGGGHVWKLREAGFTRALAADKFIPADVVVDGVTVAKKADIFEIGGEFDLITFHHSFEHMEAQVETLARCRQLLAPGGRVLVRVPTVTSYAWEHYRQDWVSLDAPRHLYLHSHASLRLLADRAGFTVARLWCDSTAFQFWGSEQYRRDIPLDSERSYAKNAGGSMFTAAEIAAFERRAEQLNAELRGDSVCVLLTPGKGGAA